MSTTEPLAAVTMRIARQLQSDFGRYRRSLEMARDTDEPRAARTLAWTRAANARARIERGIARLANGEAAR